MTLYILLALMSGAVLLEGVVVEMAAIRRRKPGPALSQVTDLGTCVNRWILPMMAAALTGGVLLRIGERLILGGLVQVSGAAVFTTFLVIFLYCMTSEAPA
jgi:hypothetical protein